MEALVTVESVKARELNERGAMMGSGSGEGLSVGFVRVS